MSLLPAVSASLDEQVLCLRTGCGARELTELSVLEARGADRAAWLNGLVTQDTRALQPGRAVYAAAVAVKGKLLTDLWVLARAESLVLLVPAARADELFAHLDRYIVMEDVTLARLDASVVSLQGPAARAPALPDAFAVDRLGLGGVDLVVPSSRRAELAAALVAWLRGSQACIVGEEAWERARVMAAVPRFGVDFDATNFVQEAAITPRAVSFNKGCYLGQEVVCRLEMRGQVQRHLVALTLSGDAAAPGDIVRCEGADVGVVTSAAPTPAGAEALAMVRRAAAEKTLELRGRAAVTGRVFGA